MWVARDKNNKIHLFTYRPVRDKKGWWTFDENIVVEYDERRHLPIELFPGLKWKDEPIEVELIEKSESMSSDVADILIKDKMKIGAYDIEKIKSWNESSGYPYREPLRFYLSKETYTFEYYKIIANAVLNNNNVLINWHYNITNQVGEVSINCIDTLDNLWNFFFKKIYEEE